MVWRSKSTQKQRHAAAHVGLEKHGDIRKKTYISIIIWREKMRISYRPLWVMLAEREITKKQLRELSGISTASLAKLGKGENLTTDTLLKICKALNCSITEIMETVPDVRQDESICEE